MGDPGRETPPKMLKPPPLPGIPFFPGEQATHPREGSFRRRPVAELGVAVRSFAGDTEGCGVGRARRSRAAVKGRVALGKVGAPRGVGHTKTEIV